MEDRETPQMHKYGERKTTRLLHRFCPPPLCVWCKEENSMMNWGDLLWCTVLNPVNIPSDVKLYLGCYKTKRIPLTFLNIYYYYAGAAVECPCEVYSVYFYTLISNLMPATNILRPQTVPLIRYIFLWKTFFLGQCCTVSVHMMLLLPCWPGILCGMEYSTKNTL